MAEINVPIVTIPQLHDSLQTLSATDLIPIVQGSEYDRDAAATLSEILSSDAVKNAASWKTFTPENGTIATGTWDKNALVLMQAWANEIINTGSTIKDSVMIVMPKWGSTGTKVTTSCKFTHNLTTGEDFSFSIPAGNLLIVSFGADAKVSEYARLPMSADNTSAIFKTLSVTDSISAASANISGMVKAVSAIVSGSVSVRSASGAVNTSMTSDKVSASSATASSELDANELTFVAAGSAESGTYSSDIGTDGGEFSHVTSSTSQAGVTETSTRTFKESAASLIVEQTDVTIDTTTTPIVKVTALTRTTTSPEGIIIYAHTTSVQVTEVGGVWTEVAGTTTTSVSTSSFKIGELSVVGDLAATGNLLTGGDLRVAGKLITPAVESHTSDVDLSVYVVAHSMVYGQHLFVINTGTGDITVTGKVTSGSSEITKTWTLAICTMCDFVAVPTASGSNAIAKLG